MLLCFMSFFCPPPLLAVQVKLTPGKQKRGKASKQAIEVFSRARDTPASQKALMKGVTDNECVQAMIGDVKVAVAGLAQATQVSFGIQQ